MRAVSHRWFCSGYIKYSSSRTPLIFHEAQRYTIVANPHDCQDQTALSALYELTVERVYGVLVDVLASKEEAISVACDTYVFVWHNA